MIRQLLDLHCSPDLSVQAEVSCGIFDSALTLFPVTVLYYRHVEPILVCAYNICFNDNDVNNYSNMTLSFSPMNL